MKNTHHEKTCLALKRIPFLCLFFVAPLLRADEARFRYVNAYGERLCQSEYYYASDFSCGFGMAQTTNGEWVVVDSAGNEKGTGIVGDPGEFRGDPCFSEGVALLSVDDDEKTSRSRTYAIGTDASVLFTLEYAPFGPFCHGMALVFDEEKVFPIDFLGRVPHSNRYDIAVWFPDSTLGVGLRQGEKHGVDEAFWFDGAGRETRFGRGSIGIGYYAGSLYAEYGEFRGDSADRRIRILSADGRVLFEREPVTLVNLGNRGEGLLGFIHCEEDRKHIFFVDLAGRDVLTGTDTNRLKAVCSEGMIRCWNKPSGLYGFVDRTGKTRVPPQFLDAGDFSEGLAWVIDKNGELGYIDTKGKMRIATGCKVRLPWYDGRDFHNGIAVIPAK